MDNALTAWLRSRARLRPPAADELLRRPDWHTRAACRGEDVSAFFPTRGRAPRRALKICTGCTVRFECLEWALVFDESEGVWGGATTEERRQIRDRMGGE
ncbi:MAG: WhiB family transcriptional regulator [Acidimicrobiales bacterium]